jgi:STE24 endopeptidase
MNVIFWLILGALLVEFLIGLFSTFLNLRALKTVAPDDLADVYESEQYSKAQEYTRAHSRFGILDSFLQLIIGLLFWFLGGFNYVDQLVRTAGWSEIWTGVVFIGILAIAFTVISIPSSLYATFVIEERFGFNKTTYKTYAVDTIKSLCLSFVIGIPLIAGVLFFFQYMGSLAWLYAWVFVTLLSVALSVIAPMWIMPLFNKFTPLEPGELRDAIVEYAKKVTFTYGNIYVIDGSKRSAHSNAFFTGFGKTKRIALFDTLIQQLNTDELVAVIAHEVGHNKKKHIISGMLLGVLHTGVLFFFFSLLMNNQLLFEAFFMDNTSIYASLVFLGFLFAPIELIISMVTQAISRKHEYEADRWAVETVTNKQNLISGLKKLAANNLANLSPHPVFVLLHFSHPPLSKRIEAINVSDTIQ